MNCFFHLAAQRVKKLLAGVLYLGILTIAKAQHPQLQLPVGHTSIISAMDFSPDGQFVVSGSWDNTAKIWETSSGRLLHELKSHTASVIEALYSKDGKWIVTGSKDSTVCLWSAIDGHLVWKTVPHSDWVTHVVFGADQLSIISGSADGAVYRWKLATGEKLMESRWQSQWISAISKSKDQKWWVTASWDSTLILRKATDTAVAFKWKVKEGRIRFVFFTAKDKYLVAGTDRNSIYIWSVADKKLIQKLEVPGSEVKALRPGTDESMIITGNNNGEVMQWSFVNGKKINQWKAHNGPINDCLFSNDKKYFITAGADSQTIVWSWPTGKRLRTMSDNQGEVNLLHNHPDNNYLLTASYDNSLRVWNLADGKRKALMSSHTFWVNNISYDLSGTKVVSASNDNTARIWNASGALKETLIGHTDWVNTAVFSKDGKFVLTASNDRTARLWQVSDGSMVQSFLGHEDWVSSAEFSPDGNYILTASTDNTAKIWLRSNGQLLHNLKGHTDWINTATYSADGKWVLTASIDNTARIWDAISGTQVMLLGGKDDSLRYAAFSPDADKIVTASKDHSLKVWQRNNGQLLYTWIGHTGWINKVIFSPDGNSVASTSLDHSILLWSMTSGKLLYSLKGHTGGISDAVFSSDGRFLISGSWDHTARIWDLQTGLCQNVLNGHTDIINSVAYSPDGKFILTSSEDNTIKKWNAGTGELLYSFFSIDTKDFLVFDQKGRYDGSPAARKLLYYICGNEIVDFEQLKELAWEPGLAEKLSGNLAEPITALMTEELPLCNYTPLVKSIGFDNGIYRFEVIPRNGGLEGVQVFVNAKMISSYDTKALLKKGKVYILNVPLSQVRAYFNSGEENTVTVKASSANGTSYSRGAVISVVDNKKKANPNMYVVSIGISRYKSDKLQLKYASKDSRELGSALLGSGQKLLNTDNKQHVYNFILNTDTNAKYWPTKKNIQAVMDSIIRKAQPDDVVIVFFAGHGMLYNTGKSFYLLTADAAGFDIEGIEKQVGISAEELNQWMSGIKANKQVLILDACNSGKVIQRVKDVMGKRGIPADQQRALERLKDKTGTFILSAAASDQSAYETSLYRQGLLTYSLLTGLKLGQGLKDNKYIDVNRWFNFAADNVKILAKDIGGRQDPQIIGNGSFDLGLVDEEVSENIHLSIRRKLFRESRFIQDEQLLNDDLEIADHLDRELDNLSLSGKESPIIFVAGNKLADAYSVRGKYEVSGNQIHLQAWVVKGSSERILSLQASGTKEEKDKMILGLVEKIRNYFDNNE